MCIICEKTSFSSNSREPFRNYLSGLHKHNINEKHYKTVNRHQSIAGFAQYTIKEFAPTRTASGQKQPWRCWMEEDGNRVDRTGNDGDSWGKNIKN